MFATSAIRLTKRYAVVALLAASFATTVGCRAAVSEASADQQSDQQKGETTLHEGVVMSAAAKPFVIMSDDGMQHSFVVGDKTKIRINGREAKLGSIKAGDTAKVTSARRDGQFMATSISVDSPYAMNE